MKARMVDSGQIVYNNRQESEISQCGQQRLSHGGTCVVVHFWYGMIGWGHCKEVQLAKVLRQQKLVFSKFW